MILFIDIFFTKIGFYFLWAIFQKTEYLKTKAFKTIKIKTKKPLI